PNQLGWLALNLLEQKKYVESEPFARESLTIREKNWPDHWMTFHTRSLLGGALLGQGRDREAEPLLRQGYEGLKERQGKIPEESRVRRTRALDRLVQLHDAGGKKAEAAGLRKELQAGKPGQKR